ncbi:MAG: class I SAM-dependent methyltransferase [Saprospirales bacterium]|nr:class I SAM-dependent methyltransferase [Saprospirales bacterium]
MDWNLRDMLEALHIRYLVTDARKLPLNPESLDLIVSNNTFEHIYPNILAEILAEFKRLLRPGGMMSHFIDMSDHFAHLDTGITIYNFLRFSEKNWGWIDNSIQPQNRWRISHYRHLYKNWAFRFPKKRTARATSLSSEASRSIRILRTCRRAKLRSVTVTSSVSDLVIE